MLPTNSFFMFLLTASKSVSVWSGRFGRSSDLSSEDGCLQHFSRALAETDPLFPHAVEPGLVAVYSRHRGLSVRSMPRLDSGASGHHADDGSAQLSWVMERLLCAADCLNREG